jgi:hypothetical protein
VVNIVPLENCKIGGASVLEDLTLRSRECWLMDDRVEPIGSTSSLWVHGGLGGFRILGGKGAQCSVGIIENQICNLVKGDKTFRIGGAMVIAGKGDCVEERTGALAGGVDDEALVEMDRLRGSL